MHEPTAEPADTAEQVSAPPPLVPDYRRRPVVAHVRYPCCGRLGPRGGEHECAALDEGGEA